MTAAIGIGYSFGYGAGEDSSSTPGNVTVTSFRGTAAWAGAATQCTITNTAFPANRQVFITPIQGAGPLADVRPAVTPPTGGNFTANRSSGSPGTQSFHWRVDA